MSVIKHFGTLLFCLVICIHSTFALRGCVTLDSLCINKIIPKFQVVLLKFDIQFPYGDKHEEYGYIAEGLKDKDQVLVADIYIQDYGDYENVDIGERYNITKPQFPVLLLFKNGDMKNPVRFPDNDDFKAYRIKQFLKQHTGIRIPQENCLPEFDELAELLMAPKATKSDKETILRKAEKKGQTVTEDEKKSAEIYIHLMEKVVERGNLFIASEQERVRNILAGTITNEKRIEMMARQRILQSFMNDELQSFSKNEL